MRSYEEKFKDSFIFEFGNKLMISFIFFGRLEYSKGIDLVINFISSYSEFCKQNSFNFYIFGDGRYKKEVENLASNFDFVQYFGWESKDTIRNYLKKSDFTLMPSRFLETFGLSALESISEGVPVIGFKKGGLRQFIFDEFDILNYNHFFRQSQKNLKGVSNNDIRFDNIKLFDVISRGSHLEYYFNNWFLKNDLWNMWNEELKIYYKKICLEIVKDYRIESWFESFLEFIK